MELTSLCSIIPAAGLASLTATNAASLNQWYHVTGVVDRPAGTVKTYVNGVLDKTGTFFANSPATAVGESPFSLTSAVNASFDEIRAETKARSADWVKATFDNQKTASNNFWTFGTATGPPVLASSLTDETFAKDAYTYTMVATGSPSGFAAFGLPDGLTVNPSSGVISGTPMVATTASINLVFEYPDGSLLGSLNDNNASALIMTLLIKPKLPIVKTKAAANVSATRADLNGEVQEDGGAIVSANVYYGTSDGGTDPNAWASVYPAGNVEGNFTVPMGNLVPGTTYHYRYLCFNAAATTGVWSDQSMSFTTSTSVVPVVGNNPLGT